MPALAELIPITENIITPAAVSPIFAVFFMLLPSPHHQQVLVFDCDLMVDQRLIARNGGFMSLVIVARTRLTGSFPSVAEPGAGGSEVDGPRL
ncbi:hypothetical protein [Streptomyces sp. NBC_01185]|uniref:hypothetical protein n=1 Tax=Streptomyces sp. NBC_01185 TaxID=2903764 RepID=UPI0038662CF4|nr:hypothetical protein OG770_31555 [Streptomyces sp. NBC_01185]